MRALAAYAATLVLALVLFAMAEVDRGYCQLSWDTGPSDKWVPCDDG